MADVDQVVRSRRKTLALMVKPDGAVVVRAPLRTPENVIREFVERNRQWIERKKTAALDAAARSPRQFVSGETFAYLGREYPLEIVRGQTKPLLLEENFRLADSAHSRAPAAFESWYRQQAKQVLSERVEYYARLYDFKVERVGITSARTRWGSCSAKGSLNFSWRLILAPLECVDYVVVHELAHTVVHNHSRQFWKKVESILPDYKERRKWLRQNGHLMLLFE